MTIRADADTDAHLLACWQVLIDKHTSAAHTEDVGAALLDAWRQPHRRYHTVDHLRDVVDHVDELADHADHADAVRLAAWYHDAVYDGASDDEERSAQRAEYAHIPYAAFAAGRATLLQALLDAPAVYRTPHARQHWEPSARSNIGAELTRLRAISD